MRLAQAGHRHHLSALGLFLRNHYHGFCEDQQNTPQDSRLAAEECAALRHQREEGRWGPADGCRAAGDHWRYCCLDSVDLSSPDERDCAAASQLSETFVIVRSEVTLVGIDLPCHVLWSRGLSADVMLFPCYHSLCEDSCKPLFYLLALQTRSSCSLIYLTPLLCCRKQH